MVTPAQLERLLPVLKRHGVQQYRDGELFVVLSLFPDESPLPERPSNAPPPDPREEDPLYDHTR